MQERTMVCARSARRENSRTAGVVLMTAVLGVAALAWGDSAQNAAVRGGADDLAKVGLGAFNGGTETIAVLEAGQGIPNAMDAAGNVNPGRAGAANSTLPDGNLFLPASSFRYISQAGLTADVIRNHATQVAGVIVSQSVFEPGIAPGAKLTVGGNGTTTELATNAQRAAALGASIVNLSQGFTPTAGNPAINNGNSTLAKFVDWHAARSNLLYVVAGNETGNEGAVPSDSYNTINVGATGVSTPDGINYRRGAPYNTSNTTLDGRFKTDIVAPGGDPGPNGVDGTFNALPGSVNRFLTTAGGQWQYVSGTGVNPGESSAYRNDSVSGSSRTGSPGVAFDNTAPFVAGPPFTDNPGASLGGDDVVRATRIAGTSFAAPVVAGAAAVLQEVGVYGGLSLDHRVIKSVLLNGAAKRFAGGTRLLDQNGNPWSPTNFANKANTDTGDLDVPVRTGLSPTLGTGMLDVTQSALNYIAGQYDAGNVPGTGWDIAEAGRSVPSEYIMTNIGGEFRATVCWDAVVNLAGSATTGVWDSGATLTRSVLADIDMYLYRINADNSRTLVQYSTSSNNNVEHIYVENLPVGRYDLWVGDVTGLSTTYAVAWAAAIPEPTGLVAVGLLVAVCLRRR